MNRALTDPSDLPLFLLALAFLVICILAVCFENRRRGNRRVRRPIEIGFTPCRPATHGEHAITGDTRHR